MKADTNAPHRHALPWTRDEFISINGTFYCYTMGHDGTIIHIPGRESVRLDVFRERGAVIIPPKKWRTEDFA